MTPQTFQSCLNRTLPAGVQYTWGASFSEGGSNDTVGASTVHIVLTVERFTEFSGTSYEEVLVKVRNAVQRGKYPARQEEQIERIAEAQAADVQALTGGRI